MIFAKKEPKRFELGGESIPYICDIAVLERIQEEFGDLNEVDRQLRGYVPYRDANGVIDMNKDGHFIIPTVKVVTKVLFMMIREGLEITGEELEVTEADLKIQDDYTITELAMIAWEGFNDCFKSKNRKSPKKTR